MSAEVAQEVSAREFCIPVPVPAPPALFVPVFVLIDVVEDVVAVVSDTDAVNACVSSEELYKSSALFSCVSTTVGAGKNAAFAFESS